METIKLKTPLKVNGKDLTELKCDMDGVTVEGFIRAEALSNAKRENRGMSAPMTEVDYGFHLYLGFEGIMAADPSIDISDLERIKGGDIVKIMQAGRFFAIGADSGDSGESGSEAASENTPTSSTQAHTKSAGGR